MASYSSSIIKPQTETPAPPGAAPEADLRTLLNRPKKSRSKTAKPPAQPSTQTPVSASELERIQQELELKQKRESNLAQFARVIRWKNEDTLEAWAQNVLVYFAENFPILQASFYYREDRAENGELPEDYQELQEQQPFRQTRHYLRLLASYAADESETHQSLEYGQGLVGQAAKNCRYNYMQYPRGVNTQARSSIGVILAKALLEMPLVYNEQAEGVIEFTFAKHQHQEEINLMLSLGEMVAANLNTIRSQEIRTRLFREATEKSRMLLARDREMRDKIDELERTQQEMHQIQEELRDQEARMVSVLDSTDEEIFAIDLQRNLTFFNSAAQRFAQRYMQAEIQPGDSVYALIPEEVTPLYEQAFEDIRYGRPAAFETWVRLNEQEEAWREVRLNPIRSAEGTIYGATLFRKDVSERKQQEQAIIQLNEHLEEKVADRTKELESKNRDILDSIRYARRIQSGILPDFQQVFDLIEDGFLYYNAKDIVSGDFYWYAQVGRELVVAIVDCTGHGVPGAFMSVVGAYALNKIVRDEGETDPSRILYRMNVSIRETLRNDPDLNPNAQIHDGMDVCLVSINLDTRKLQFSGAKRPLYYSHLGRVHVLPGSKYAIGEAQLNGELPEFERQIIHLETGDFVYLFSDGIVDQFGGPKGKKFTPRRLRELLQQNSHTPGAGQEGRLRKALEEWSEGYEQTDDILIAGLQI